ncbi:MAG TPA: peptidoglycan DD-metalloendopeptidase family protein [Thermomicrobiales bacterium]|jgi:murein DD-endopeptidase MepM/ murein hydrolase activator NlpD/SH3-like domain-containing protein|nr:peptidoglycan DD-metalloendopeptidase family protein [Thermomicrobiales bacterium]
MTLTDGYDGQAAPGADRAKAGRLSGLFGRSRLVRRAAVAVLGLSLVAGPLATEARPLAVNLESTSAVISGSTTGVNIRATPSFDASVVVKVGMGTPVTLRIDQVSTVTDADGVTIWWPIRVYDVDGWVAGYYLSDTGTTGAAPGQPSDPGTTAVATTVSASSTTAYVANPAGVNIRAEAVTWAEAISFAPAGTTLVLRIDTINPVWDTEGREWWPVDLDGRLGWVAADYLGANPGTATAQTTTAPTSGAFTAGSYVTVSTTTPAGLTVRAGAAPGAAVVGYVRQGDVAQIMDGPVSYDGSAAGWYMVTSGGVTGYVSGDFLVSAAQPAAPATTPVTTAATTDGAGLLGTTATAGQAGGDNINLRSTASTAADVLAIVPGGTAVDVVDGPYTDADGRVWYYVISPDGEGFAAAALLRAGAPATTATTAPVATTEPAATTAPVATMTPEATVEPEPSTEPEATTEPEPTTEPAVEASQDPEPVYVSPAPGFATGSFLVPTAGRVSQNYGCTSLPFYPIDPNSGCPFHDGLDIAAEQGTPIIASDGGTVTFAGWCECGLGYYVEIDHGNGYVTRYGHMASQPYVSLGQQVSQGEVIGPIGSTGFSTGPHIHFMVILDGTTVSPELLLPAL